MSTLPLILAAVVSATPQPDVVLLDFYSDNCPPCVQMAPVVEQLIAAGYPVRKIHAGQQPDLVAQYQVKGWPCFILLVDGRESGRILGATAGGELVRMFEAVGYRPGADAPTATAPAKSTPNPFAAATPPSPESAFGSGSAFNDAVQATPTTAEEASPSISSRLLASTVRIAIDDTAGRAFGTGTVIHAQANEALVLTCGHLFREAATGDPTVDLFLPSGLHRTVGKVLHYDLHRDTALLVVRTPEQLTPATLARGLPKVGGVAFSVGCDLGEDPTVWSSQVTAIDRYLGPPNIEAAKAPVQGRSGGGLFNEAGELIGVCNASDEELDEGLYASLPAIVEELQTTGLGFLAGVEATRPTALAASNTKPAQSISSASASDASPVAVVPEKAASEVVCVIRPLGQPGGKSEVVVLERASQEFLSQLRSEKTRQQARSLTKHVAELQRPHHKTEREPIYGGWRPTGTVLR